MGTDMNKDKLRELAEFFVNSPKFKTESPVFTFMSSKGPQTLTVGDFLDIHAEMTRPEQKKIIDPCSRVKFCPDCGANVTHEKKKT